MERATVWLKQREAAFSSKQMCSRTVTAIRYWLGEEYSIDELRFAVANSYLYGDHVGGELGRIPRLGVRVFEELQRVVLDRAP